jgi:hypothetical protein
MRLKCKKCGNVFEQNRTVAAMFVHVGPYHRLKCPACSKSGWFNFLSSVTDPITWPAQEKTSQQEPVEPQTEEELEKKRINDSKYEKP